MLWSAGQPPGRPALNHVALGHVESIPSFPLKIASIHSYAGASKHRQHNIIKRLGPGISTLRSPGSLQTYVTRIAKATSVRTVRCRSEKFKTVKKGYCTVAGGSAIIIARAREVCGVARCSWQWRLALFGSRPAWWWCPLALLCRASPFLTELVVVKPSHDGFRWNPFAHANQQRATCTAAERFPARKGNITPHSIVDHAPGAHSPPAAAAVRASRNTRCWHRATTGPPSAECPGRP